MAESDLDDHEKDQVHSPRAPTPGPWARVATLIVVLVLLGLSAVAVTVRLLTPSDGTWVPPSFIEWHDQGVTVWEIGDGQAELQRDDIVVAVDGRNLGDGPPPWRTSFREGDQLVYQIQRDGQPTRATVVLERFPLGSAVAERWGILAFAAPLLAVAMFIFRHNPNARAAQALLIFATGMAASSVPFVLGIGAVDIAAGPMAWLRFATSNVGFLIGWCGLVALALWFPEPHPAFATRPGRAALVAFGVPLGVLAATTLLAPMMGGSFVRQLALVFAVQQVLIVACIVSAFILAVLTWRRTTDPVALQQLRWFAGSGCLSALLVLAGWFLPDLMFGQRALPDNLLGLAGVPVLVGGTVAVLRYKMFELDIVLNRTLVYGALTAILAGVFVLVAAAVGALAGSLTDVQASVVAAGVVALVVNPFRRLLQRSVNRLFYGDRDEPYAALARLGRRLEVSQALPAVLPGVAVDVVASLRIPFAAIDVVRNSSMERIAAVGQPRGMSITIPLVHQTEIVGQLVVSPRTEIEPLSEADRRVLADLASPIGAAAANMQLAEHLQRSREDLVVAREEERRRLRRELHDGLGPTLSALALQIEGARRQMASNPAEADTGLEKIRQETQRIIDDIRRMAYELRPPTLDELGLVEALRERALVLNETSSTGFTVETNGFAPDLPAAVEVAAFRIAFEAMANVVRHARAQTCTVHIAPRSDQPPAGDHDDDVAESPASFRNHPTDGMILGALEIEILDDGDGLPDGFRSGVGLSSMQERAAELGGTCTIDTRSDGGTRVHALLPLERE